MSLYEVWFFKRNLRPPWLEDLSKLPKASTLSRTHVFVTALTAESYHDVFMRMTNWRPDVAAARVIAREKLDHSVIHIGDVIVKLNPGELAMVGSVGFCTLEFD